jgi:hypothetical protein
MLGIRSEAQIAAAVLNRKFSRQPLIAPTRSMLKAKGLDSLEDEKSWISSAL